MADELFPLQQRLSESEKHLLKCGAKELVGSEFQSSNNTFQEWRQNKDLIRKKYSELITSTSAPRYENNALCFSYDTWKIFTISSAGRPEEANIVECFS